MGFFSEHEFDTENLDADICYIGTNDPWNIKRTLMGDILIATASLGHVDLEPRVRANDASTNPATGESKFEISPIIFSIAQPETYALNVAPTQKLGANVSGFFSVSSMARVASNFDNNGFANTMNSISTLDIRAASQGSGSVVSHRGIFVQNDFQEGTATNNAGIVVQTLQTGGTVSGETTGVHILAGGPLAGTSALGVSLRSDSPFGSTDLFNMVLGGAQPNIISGFTGIGHTLESQFDLDIEGDIRLRGGNQIFFGGDNNFITRGFIISPLLGTIEISGNTTFNTATDTIQFRFNTQTTGNPIDMETVTGTAFTFNRPVLYDTKFDIGKMNLMAL